MGELTRRAEQITDRESWLAKRAGFLGASEVAALFHSHPYLTCLELWAQKSGRLERDDTDTAHARRGRLFESAVGEALREEYPQWRIAAGRQYHMLPDERMACTPDFVASIDGKMTIIQAKIVTPDKFESEWRDAPPVAYLMQLQAEMLITGIPRGVLAPLIFDGWNFPVHAYHFPADDTFQLRLLGAARQFWHHVDNGLEPRLKLPQDRATLGRLFPDGDGEPPMILAGRDDLADLCAARKAISEETKRLVEQKETIDGKLMDVLRNHSKAEIPGRYRINWTTIPAAEIPATTRKSYRRLSISEIKPRKAEK